MFSNAPRKGQALILIALAAIGLFSFSALAIDGSRVYSDKRHAQNAADTAVLAAALAEIRCKPAPCSDTAKFAAAKAAAQLRANSNGYDDGATNDVLFYYPPIDGPYLGNSEYIQVKIISTIPTTFARVFGRRTFTNSAQAIARVRGGSSSSGGWSWGDAAMVTTSSETKNDCFLLNGGADVAIHGSGIYVNCPSEKAIKLNSNIKLDMDAHGKVVGCYDDVNIDKSKPLPYDPIDCHVNGGIAKTYGPADFAAVPTMPTPPVCNKSSPKTYASGSGAALTPGYYPGDVKVDGGKNVVMNPGLYCFGKEFTVEGTLTALGGPVQIVIDGNFNDDSTSAKFKDVEIFSKDGSFTVKGALETVGPGDRFRFYSSGDSKFIVNSHGTLKSGNAYIYLAGGDPKWNSDSNIDVIAPPQNDPFGVGGLFIYMPWDNDTPVTLNGGSTVKIYGTMLMPHAGITFNGDANFELHSQVIGYEMKVNGGADLDIYYLASQNYGGPPSSSSTIELSN